MTVRVTKRARYPLRHQTAAGGGRGERARHSAPCAAFPGVFSGGKIVQPKFAGTRYILEKICPDQNVELVNTQYTSLRPPRSDERYSYADSSTETRYPVAVFSLYLENEKR
jgi:hypothetical protein